MTQASQRQIDYILTLYNRLHGTTARYLSQTELGLTMRERQGNIDKVKASKLIDDLKAELDKKS